MAWEGSDRKLRLPPDWSKRRQIILKRDGFQCTWIVDGENRCAARATDVDHIQPGDDHSLTNLRSLCGFHHNHKSALEGVAARAARPRRPPEPHPGRIA